MQQENRISALECIIGIPYQDFRLSFVLLHCLGLTFLVNTVHKHQ